MINRKRLVQNLVGVYGFYDRELTEFAIRVWCDAMAEFETEAVEQALQRHLKNPNGGQFLPKPADLVRELRGDAADGALLAWGEVLRVARAGGAGHADLPPASRLALQDMGGIGVIARADEAENGFLQRRFVDAFQAFRRREESPPLALHHTQQPRLQ